MEKIEREILCEIAYCVWLYKIDAFTNLENWLNFYEFALKKYKQEENMDIYEFCDGENLDKLIEERNRTENPETIG